ncbi:MAG: hypothetical protein Q9181_002568 [Wetmoreana brouardii]
MQYDYRPPRSEVGSSTTGRYPLDSGYESRSGATRSVRSADQVDPSRCPSISGDIHGLRFYPEDGYQDPSARDAAPPNPQYSPTDISQDVAQQPGVPFDLACQYPNCSVISKNQSEQRKHMLRHQKPFKCDVSGCTKVDGFSTNNDLDRHRKSVHKIMPNNSTDRSFRCAARNCPKKDKIWPRLDNFRQHCVRIHHDMDCDELVKKSELDPGFSMQASNLYNSSNHDVGDTSPGLDPSGIPDYLNPSVMFDPPQTQNVRPISPNPPDVSSNVSHYAPYLQMKSNMNQFLQVPGPNASRKRSLSFPEKISAEEPNAKLRKVLGGLPRRKLKEGKPLTSAKRAEEVSDELALEIAEWIESSKGSREDIQAAIKHRVLLALNVDPLRKGVGRGATPEVDLGPRKRRKITCDQCSVTTARQCDMRKHKKRHTRPYGCTFPSCHKRLGSKNDWKRHENTQHYQIETWRCHEYSKESKIGQCANVFYRREQFQGHLREKHHIQDEQEIREQCQRNRIGRNGQNRFWCGFCRQLIELKAKGLDAWEERFNHIDNLHYKQGRTIYEWVHMDKDVPEEVLGRDEDRESGSRENDDEEHTDEDGSSGSDEGDRCSQNSAPNHASPRVRPNSMAYAAGVDVDSHISSTGQAAVTRRGKIWHCCSTSRLAYPDRGRDVVRNRSHPKFGLTAGGTMSGGHATDNAPSSLVSENIRVPVKRPKSTMHEKYIEESEEAEENDAREMDVRTKQVFHGRLAYQSVGVIYGDIGTSPLYVYSSTFTSNPSYDDLLGALSLIIWTITLMVSVKYVLIVLRADDEGEGGTFAIYSLLSRYANIVRRDPREERSIKMERVQTSSLPTTSKHTRSFLEQSTVMKTTLKIVGVLGVSLVMSDGILTPAQSIVDESITTATIVGTSCAILVLLFLIQPFAFSPAFAGQYLIRNKTEGWRSLGGILLAFTGVEALFADLGAFTRRPQGNSNVMALFCLPVLTSSRVYFTSLDHYDILLSQIIKLSYFPQIKLIHTSKIFHGQIYIPWVNWLLMTGTIIVTVAYNNPLPFVIVGFLVFGAFDGLYLSSALTKVPDGAWFTLILAVLLSSIFILWRFGKENQWQAEASDHLALSSIVRQTCTDRPAGRKDTSGLRFTSSFGSASISAINGMGIFFDKSGLPDTTPTVFIHFLQKFQAAPNVVVFFHIRPLPLPTVLSEERFTTSRCLRSGAEDLKHHFFRVTLRHGYTDEVVSQDLGFQIYEQLRNFVIREDPIEDVKNTSNSQSVHSAPDGRAFPQEPTSRMPCVPSEECITAHDINERACASITDKPDPDTTKQQERVRQTLSALEAAYQDQVVYIVGKEHMRIHEVKGCKPRGWCRRIALTAFLWLRSNIGSKIANFNIDVDKLVEIGFVKVV